MSDTAPTARLLVFNCHEAWVHQLEGSGYDLDIVVGLEGRHTREWDECMRPVPENARLVALPDALARIGEYACVVAHNITDLLDVKEHDAPKLLVLHSTVEGRLDTEGAQWSPEQVQLVLGRYLTLCGGGAIAVSHLKARSWGIPAEVVFNGVDVARYEFSDGSFAAGVRVCNHFNRRRRVLMADLHERAMAGVPVTLIGHNPDLAGVSAAHDWGDLRRRLAKHRFYVHTADPLYEDGFNMALFEAMASGLPILGNAHPSSPVIHGESGFLSDDPAELNDFAQQLLSDRELALTMGQAARECVARRFPLSAFHAGIQRAVEGLRARRRLSEAK